MPLARSRIPGAASERTVSPIVWVHVWSKQTRNPRIQLPQAGSAVEPGVGAVLEAVDRRPDVGLRRGCDDRHPADRGARAGTPVARVESSPASRLRRRPPARGGDTGQSRARTPPAGDPGSGHADRLPPPVDVHPGRLRGTRGCSEGCRCVRSRSPRSPATGSAPARFGPGAREPSLGQVRRPTPRPGP